jgi:hypothetical protein
MHPFEVVHEGFFNHPLGLGPQTVDELKQEIHQDIREFPTAEQTESGQEGHPERHGMPAEFIGFFDCDPLAVCLEYGWGHVVKQGRGELECPDVFQFSDFLEQVVQGRAPGVRPEFLEQCTFEGGCGEVRVGSRGLSRT